MKSLFFSLTANQPYIKMDTVFEAATIVVENKTGSAVFIRVGAQDQPSSVNADITVPAGMSQSYPTNGYTFSAAFDNPAAISTAVAAKSGLFQTCKIQFLDKTELSPSYGTASFLSLSISELQPITALPGPTNSPVFDIGAWGGALVYINPTSISGQGLVTVQVSNDGATYYTLKSFAFWPGVPAVLIVPRVAKFFRLQFNILAGEPAMDGTYSVRATLEEIQNIAYNPSSNSIIKSFNLPGIAAQQWTFLTVGLPAVSLAAIATAGTTSGANITFLVEASSDGTNYRRVTFRTQRMSQGVTLYRALGQVDIFLRVSITQNTGGETCIGSLYASIPQEVDLGYILNTIQQSLGDLDAPSNTNQDIYHELDNMRASLISMNSIETTYLPSINTGTNHMAAIDTNVASSNAFLTNINTQSNSIANSTAHLPTIDTNVASSNAFLTNINTQSNNIANGTAHLPAIDTNISSSNSFLSNINTQSNSIANGTAHLPAMDTNLATLATSNARASRTPIGNAFSIAAANTWTNVGALLTPGDFITFSSVGYFTPANSNGVAVLLATGTGAGVSTLFFIGNITEPTPTRGSSITMKYDSLRSAGFQVPAGHTNLWLQADIVGTMYVTIAVTS